MNKFFFLLGLLFPSLLFGQAGEFFFKMPAKYELPFPGMSTSISDDATEKVWYVMTANDGVPVYSDERCMNQKSTEKFLSYYAVWKESENAVLCVRQEDDLPIINGYVFTSNAKEVGWIRKSDLILNERCLSVDRVLVKAILKKVPENLKLPNNKPGFKGKIESDEFGAFNVLKIEPEAWLLCKTDLVHKDLKNEDVFWVERSEISTIKTNKAYVPDWRKVENGSKLYAYSDIIKSGKSDTLGAASKVYKNNPFIGYFLINDTNGTHKIFNPLLTGPDTLFINSTDAGFIPANFIDNNQFTELMEFARLLSNSPTKEILKFELLQFFSQRSIDIKDDKFSAMNVADLLGYALGIDLSGYSSGTPTLVDDIKDMDIESYYKVFSTNYERLLSEKEVGPYRFFSGIAYYWLPQNFLALDVLSGITLSKPRIGKINASVFKEFTVFYIDHSSPDKSYEQLQAEIRKLYGNLNTVWNVESEANDIGDLIYYSSGMDPVISSGEVGFEQIAGQMRNSSTIRPDRLYDKLRLENAMFSQIKFVTDKISINFDVSEFFYRSEIEGRTYFFKEFVERINSIIATRNTRITITFYYGTNLDPQILKSLETLCNTNNGKYQNIKFSLYKYI